MYVVRLHTNLPLSSRGWNSDAGCILGLALSTDQYFSNNHRKIILHKQTGLTHRRLGPLLVLLARVVERMRIELFVAPENATCSIPFS